MKTLQAFLEDRRHRGYKRARTLLDGVYIAVAVLLGHANGRVGITGAVALVTWPLVQLFWGARIAINETGIRARWLWFRQDIPWSQITDVSLKKEFLGARLVVDCQHGRRLWLITWSATADRTLALVRQKSCAIPENTPEMAWPWWLR
jgi:hypothetical protein